MDSAILIYSLPIRSRNALACDVFDVIATLASLAHDVTHADRWAQNDSHRSCVFVTFELQFLTHRMKNEHAGE